MDIAEIDEIMACLPRQRTLFHYHKDRYALMLLAWAAGDGCSVDQLRRGRFAPLLEKPAVKQVLAHLGGGRLDRATLEAAWPDACSTFLLTLGRWGSGDRGWDQTSRKGHNLVLRLNFNHGHDRSYRRLVKPDYDDPFTYSGHPILRRGERRYMRQTLAWARLDIDLSAGEALIEEIQSDWVRGVAELADDARKLDQDGLQQSWGCRGTRQEVGTYVERVFAPYRGIWDQAMLSAAVRFIRDELGVTRIWYHSWDGGNRLKRLRYSRPPRSLYTRLPQRFCFQRTEQAPGFIGGMREYRKLVRKTGSVRWFRLAL